MEATGSRTSLSIGQQVSNSNVKPFAGQYEHTLEWGGDIPEKEITVSLSPRTWNKYLISHRAARSPLGNTC